MLGLRQAIRVGTCGALAPALRSGAGVAREAISADGTSRALGAGDRVAADARLTRGAARARGARRRTPGAVVSTDLFYDAPTPAPGLARGERWPWRWRRPRCSPSGAATGRRWAACWRSPTRSRAGERERIDDERAAGGGPGDRRARRRGARALSDAVPGRARAGAEACRADGRAARRAAGASSRELRRRLRGFRLARLRPRRGAPTAPPRRRVRLPDAPGPAGPARCVPGSAIAQFADQAASAPSCSSIAAQASLDAWAVESRPRAWSSRSTPSSMPSRRCETERRRRVRRSMSAAEGRFRAPKATSCAWVAFSRASKARAIAPVSRGFSAAPGQACPGCPRSAAEPPAKALGDVARVGHPGLPVAGGWPQANTYPAAG